MKKFQALIYSWLVIGLAAQDIDGRITGEKTIEGKFSSAGDSRRYLEFDNRQRFYDLHIPQNYNSEKVWPVVLVFHGGLGNPGQQRHDSQMDDISDKYGFIVVYPAGTGQWEDKLLTFNSGSGFGYAKKNNIDDVGFTRALLDDLKTYLTIDENRVYATGFSNGAFMCYRLAFELSDRIAAFAPVSGVLGVAPGSYTLNNPVPIIHFHGKQDEYVPYEGGFGTKSIEPINHPSVTETIQFWVSHNECPEEPAEGTGTGNAVCTVYAPGREGSEVILWTLNDGGHTWPGGSSTLSEAQVGKINMDISASELMWQFFERHPMVKISSVTTAPYIGHIQVKRALCDKDIPIRASVVDDEGVQVVNLYYRNTGGGGYSEVPMVYQAENIYMATITASVVTTAGIDYYIFSKDSSDNVRYDPPNGPSAPYQIKVSKIIFEPHGPSIVAYVWAMIMDPKNNNVLYLSTDYGYYKSIDAGKTWKAIGDAVKDGKENTAHGAGPALAIDPATPTTVYVAPLSDFGGNAPEGRGIYKSTDGGNNFKNIGLDGKQIYGITPDNANPGRLYVCRSEGRFSGATSRYGSLWRSDNSGETFYALDVIKQGTDPAISVLTIDPTSNGKILYAGTWGFGIYKSVDGGNNWTAINTELPLFARILPKGITVNPSTPTTVYALEIDGGVYRTLNGGGTWTAINNGLVKNQTYFSQANRNGSQVVVCPTSPNTLYLPTRNGAYKSVDNGDTWTEKNNANAIDYYLPADWYFSGNSMVIDHKNPDIIYYGCEGGIFRSTNKGEFWTKTNEGLHCVFGWTLNVGTSAGHVYFGTGEQRVYKTEDFGKTWRQIPGQAPNTIGLFYAYLGNAGPVAINPSTPTTIYTAGSNGWGPLFDDYTIYKSIDDGKNWVKKKGNGLPPPTGNENDDVRWYALAIDPFNPDTLYTGGGKESSSFGIYKTTDGGESWYQTAKKSGRFWKIRLDPKNPDVIYGANRYGPAGEEGIWKSETRGEGTWTQSLNGKGVRDIAIHPWNTNILYAAATSGLYKSLDGAKTWERIAEGRPISVAIDPFVPDVLYVENWETDDFVAMYRSPDGGGTWQKIKDTQYGANTSRDPVLKVEALAIDPHIPNSVYFCNWGEGFWRSEVCVGAHTTFGIYTPPIVTQGEPFKTHIVALDKDKWVITNYDGQVELSVDTGSITPTFVNNFTNGISTVTLTLNTPGTITIIARDGDKLGTVAIAVMEYKGPYVKIEKSVRNITRNTGYQDTLSVIPGDLLEYKLLLTNIGSETARWVVIKDALPNGVTYQTESILVDGATQTDQKNDDKANFTNNTITIGKDKDNTTGNPTEIPIPTQGTVTILYQVKIN